MTTQKLKKKKLTIAQLQPTPKRLKLVHPDETIDVGDAWIDLRHPETSTDYMLNILKISALNVEEMNYVEQLNVQLDLVAPLIVGWNEDSFGVPYNADTAKELLSQPVNFWIREAIQKTIQAESDFFTKA